MVDDQIQETETDFCRIFQLYSFENLVQPFADSKVINNKNQQTNPLFKLLNEIFNLGRAGNKEKMETSAEENNIKFS